MPRLLRLTRELTAMHRQEMQEVEVYNLSQNAEFFSEPDFEHRNKKVACCFELNLLQLLVEGDQAEFWRMALVG